MSETGGVGDRYRETGHTLRPGKHRDHCTKAVDVLDEKPFVFHFPNQYLDGSMFVS